MDILSLDHDELIVKEFWRMGLWRRWPITSRDVRPQILAILGVFANDKLSFFQAVKDSSSRKLSLKPLLKPAPKKCMKVKVLEVCNY